MKKKELVTYLEDQILYFRSKASTLRDHDPAFRNQRLGKLAALTGLSYSFNFKGQHVQSANTAVYYVAEVSSAAALPGELATPIVLDHERTFRRLSILIDRFASIGFPHASGHELKISRQTADTAKTFLEIAKHSCQLPKVGTQDDGVVFAWDSEAQTTLVIVEPGLLHVVRNAGTFSSSYEENIPFDGQVIPPTLVGTLPAR